MGSKSTWMLPVAFLLATALLTGCCVQAGCGNDCDCPNAQSCTSGAAKASCCWTGAKCVKSDSDINNCGLCGKVCPAPPGAIAVCTGGQCSSQCKPGYTLCGSQCVKSDSDINNCGSCGKVCPAPLGTTAVCTAGQCSSPCTAGYTPCGPQCVKTDSDVNNCGSCGKVCPAPLGTGSSGTTGVCTLGQCSSPCTTGYTLCGTQCVAACTCPATCPDKTITFSLDRTPTITTSEKNTINLDGGSGSVTIPSGQNVIAQVQNGSLLFNTNCYFHSCNPIIGSTFDTFPTFSVNGVSSFLDVNGQSGDGDGSVGLNLQVGKNSTVIQLPGCQTLSVLSQADPGVENSIPPATEATPFTTKASFSLACFT